MQANSGVNHKSNFIAQLDLRPPQRVQGSADFRRHQPVTLGLIVTWEPEGKEVQRIVCTAEHGDKVDDWNFECRGDRENALPVRIGE